MKTQVMTIACSTIFAGALAMGAPGASLAQGSSGSAGGAQSPSVPTPLPGGSQPGGSQQGSSQQSGSQRGGAVPGSMAGGNTTLGSPMQRPATQSVPVTPQAIQMDESQIRSMLAAHGYSDIKGLEKDGSVFKVKDAHRYGATVKELRIDASNGNIRNENALSDSQVRQMLRERQYSGIGELRRDGDTIRTKAKLDGQTYELQIDSHAGTMTQRASSG